MDDESRTDLGQDEDDRASPEAETEPIEPGGLGRFLQRALRWAVVVAVAVLIGVAAIWIARVRPQAQEILGLRRELDATEGQISALREDMEALRNLEQENQALRQELGRTERHLDLLAVLVDVTTAQLALVEEDPLAAQAALEDTDEHLRQLGDGLEGEEGQAVEGLRDRLSLVRDELETDRFAARRDLEIMANNLVDLEHSLFGP